MSGGFNQIIWDMNLLTNAFFSYILSIGRGNRNPSSHRQNRKMRLRYRFDAEKALEVLLYVVERVPDTYTALKVLYFADREHLSKYGRLICGDSYAAMSHGPVPSGTYDLIKYVRGDGYFLLDVPAEEAFSVQDYDIIPRRVANLSFLSESDVECLNAAIKKYGHKSFGQLKRLSHDDAFRSADHNDTIALEAIVKSLPNSGQILEYIEKHE